MSFTKTVVASLIVLTFAVLVSAQTATGEVNGTVTDPNGAAVPGAVVKLSNQATGIETEVKTDSNGYFTFVNVRPASYQLIVEVQGFKGAQSRFTVGVSETVTQDISLALGQVSEVVEITGAGELIQRSSTELGTVISERAVQDLPLNGRNFTQLLTLSPGVTPVSTSQNRNVGGVEGNVGIPGSGFADPSFHGQQNRSKLYFYDGIINTNIRGPTYLVIPNIDLIQEFKVVGHDAKAEFGGASGGVMNMVSKSGGNNFHGSAFWYVRNDAFDARNSFDVCTAARCRPGQLVPDKPAPFRQNQFGAILTGPIISNRTFFSAGYDGWRYSQPGLGLSYVPTAAELNGDFSNFRVRNNPIFNPYSTRAVGGGFVRDRFRCDAAGNPLPVNALKQQDQTIGTFCNKIPQALIFAPMQQFFRQYAALPNFSLPGNFTQNFVQGRPTTNDSNGFQVRVDHRFNDDDNIFFRYTEHRVTVVNPIGDAGSTGGGSQGRNYGGGWTHMFTPNLIFDIRAGYAGRPGVDSGQQNQHEAGIDPLKQFGFGDIDKFAGMLVRLDTAEWTNGGNNDFGVRGAAIRENPNWSVTPNLTWLKGRHNMKTGFWYIEAKRIQLNTFQRYFFSDEQTSNPGVASTGLSLASALLGFPNNFEGQLPIEHGGPVQFKYASWAAYFQDEWRVSPNVTLTLGLRYDYLTQPKTLDGRLWNALDLPNQRWIIGAREMPQRCSVVNQAPCIPDAFFNDPHFSNVVLAGKEFFAPPPVKDNWGPRVGIAWLVNPKTVLRAGYGLYWDALPARSQYAQNDLELAVWPDATAFAGTANNSASFVNGTFANIVQIQGRGFATPLPTTNPWTPNNTFGDDPNYKDPYSQQWHLEIQRELSPTMVITAAYVGSKNGRLPYSGFGNTASRASRNTCAGNDAPCNAAFRAAVDTLRPMPWVAANINYTRSIGYSNYNALQMKFQRRFSQGLHTLVSYTWGKSIDVGSGYFNVENGPGGGSTIQNYADPSTARGVSSFDITHFVSWATVYEFPAGRGKRWFRSGLASWLLGDWQANYILQARSGQPFNLQIAGDLANLRGNAPNAPGNYLRPNLIADPFVAGPVPANPDPNCQRTISQGGRAADQVRSTASWINPCAFGIPNNTGAFGNLGRNVFRGPAVFNMDLSLFKSFPFGEDMKLQLRAEAFNVFNIQNWDVPSVLTVNSNATSIAPNVGRITALAQGTTPRQLQFGVRFVF
ncbi:MAG TPA: TonB-dependent receptor [Pyrinomonadaceae bacterium]|nr:TonB-dependent receptor [Pyrinomonadaceae bacterium]